MTDAVQNPSGPPAVLPGSSTDALANAVTLIYGDTGTGKTTLIGTHAEYVWETFKKITRLYTMDGGGFPSKVQVLMRLGIMQVWRMRNHVEPFETLELASLGYWPAEMDYRTGVAHPQVKLLPLVATEYTIKCANDHVVFQTTDKTKILANTQCPKCATIVQPQTWKLSTRTMIRPGSDKIGGAAFDGLTSWNDELMDDMADKTAHDLLGGAGSALGKGDAGKIVSGSMVFAGNNQAHYGQAQTRSRRWLTNSTTIVGLVAPPVWSALEERATDDATRLTIFGPSIAGKAKTADVPAWVGNCLRTTTRKDQSGNDEWRLYLRQHAFQEEGNIPHLTKHRTDPDRLPIYLADPPEVARDPKLRYTGFSLGNFFRMLTAAQEQAALEAAEKYADAPALVGDAPVSVEVRPEAASNFALSRSQSTETAPPSAAVAASPVPAAVAAPAVVQTSAPPTAAELFRRQQAANAAAAPAAAAPAQAPAGAVTPQATTTAAPAPEVKAPVPAAPLPAATSIPAAAAGPVQQTLPTPKTPAPPRPPVARGPVK